jgi:transposase
MPSKEVAVKYSVSRAWVDRVKQRRRQTGETTPRQQTKFRRRVLEGKEDHLAALITARPDATLMELREALRTPAALSTLWREIDRLGLTVKKNGTRRRTAAT